MQKATAEQWKEWNSITDSRITDILNSKSRYPHDRITYYVSVQGNDANDGLSPESAWKTISRVVDADLHHACVLFNRGNVWREPLVLNEDMVYSAYGKGEKPGIYGSIDGIGKQKWINTDVPNVYCFRDEIPMLEDIGNIVADEGRLWGIKILKLHSKSWCLANGIVSNGEETFERPSVPFAGYQDLKHNMEFYHDWDNRKLYIYCDKGNPGVIFNQLELCRRVTVLSSRNWGTGNILIDNLSVRYAGVHGFGGGNYYDVEIRNCEFKWIGGSVQQPETKYLFGRDYPVRLGNGIEFWKSSKNISVHDNYLTQLYDCGLTCQFCMGEHDVDVSFEDVDFCDNVVTLCNSPLEMWLSKPIEDEHIEFSIRRVTYQRNICRDAGFGWSHQRPTRDANMMYTGDAHADIYEHVAIRDNIFLRSLSMIFYVIDINIKKGYQWYDNVFCHHEGALMGILPSDFKKMSNPSAEYPYIDETISAMQTAGVIGRNTFYCE